jgi:hypothetical protein
MRRAFRKTWIWVVGIAVAVSVASCGGTEASTAEAPSPSSPPVDANVAFKQYDEASKPFECTDAYGDIGDAHHTGELAVMQGKAREYRDVMTTWDAQMRKIAFPAAAQPIVDGMRELIADEVTGLTELAEADVKDTERIATVRSEVEANDAVLMVEGDRLRAALGHPESTFGYAADLMEAADATFYKEVRPLQAKFDAAIVAGDIAGAKAANAMEIEALQRYIDKLGAIDWPPGSFEGQANTLRDHLRGQIEFDRRQTDVATTAQIVRAPEGGAPDMLAARAAFDALWKVLAQTHLIARPGSKC